MKKPSLTVAQIKEIDESFNLNLNISLLHIKEKHKYSYLLIVKSETTRFAKLTIYPIKKENVIKVTLTGLNQIDEYIENFSMKLHEYEIIHSSGLVLVEGKLFFECYLNLSLGDEKYKDLKTLLDKNKNKFKDIKIEEISLAKSKVN
ncbi:hypothetical protein ES704_03859 [subsurface metagenome]